MNRRDFLAGSAAVLSGAQQQKKERVRVGIIGTGNRGSAHLRTATEIPWVDIPAVCDVNQQALAAAQDRLQTAGRPRAEAYTGSEEAYRKMVAREDLDAVIIAAPWNFHAPMSIAAMKAGKWAGVEVPAAQTVDECWEMLRVSQSTRTPCMMLENWSFRRDNLAVLNMIRLGLLGEIVHCHCAHGHDCISWYFNRDGTPRWSGQYLLERNCDQYPTHSLGPVLSWMDINCGDAFDTIISMSNRSLGINHRFAETLGPNNPAATRHYRQGDIISSLIKTKKGNTLVLNNDMQLPRPYDDRWMIQGTEGLYSEEHNAVYLWRQSPNARHWDPFPPYMEKYEHEWCRPQPSTLSAANPLAGGHGGTDQLMSYKFYEAVRDRTPLPLTLEDSLTMSVVIPLSGESIAKGSLPVRFPDFTEGRWKTSRPYFALDRHA